MRRGEKKPGDLDRPEGNDLQTNYEKHDIGQAEIVARLEDMDCTVHDWGIDMRDDDGEDGIIYDDKMDFQVLDESGDLVALVDVKTKGSPRYMGRFNARHYVHYHGHSKDFDVPAFVVMFQVDYRSKTVYDGFVFEIGKGELGERVLQSGDSDAVNRFPDGNEAVLVPHSERHDWSYLERRIAEQKMKHAFDRELL